VNRTRRALTVLAAIGILVAAAVCVRLGFWQLSRLEEKRRLNTARQAALTQPPIEWTPGLVPEALFGRRVIVRGRYDESRHILLRGRIHEGEPGVGVVTPLRPDSGEAILISRGWLPADDGLNARPQDFPEPGLVEVIGTASPLEPDRSSPAPRLLAGAGTREPGAEPKLYSAATLDADSLAGAIPYPIARVVIRQLPGPGVPARPVRTSEPPENESMHLGYAVQWFAFAVILVAGSTWFAWTRRNRGSARNLPPSE